eukprot:8627638-Pyramimonas_sp.AAC.1
MAHGHILAGAFFLKGTAYEGLSAPGALRSLVAAIISGRGRSVSRRRATGEYPTELLGWCNHPFSPVKHAAIVGADW